MLGKATQHSYTLVLTDCDEHKYDATFLTRSAATDKMYELCRKFGLTLVGKYEDRHDITYICKFGEKFHINRVM